MSDGALNSSSHADKLSQANKAEPLSEISSKQKLSQESWLTAATTPEQNQPDKPGSARAFWEGLKAGIVDNPANGILQTIDHVTPGHMRFRLHLADDKMSANSLAGTAGTMLGSLPLFFTLDRLVAKGTGFQPGTLKSLGLTGAVQGGLFTPTNENRSTAGFVHDRLNETAIQGTTGMAMGGASQLSRKLADKLNVDSTSSGLRRFTSGVSFNAIGGGLGGIVSADGRSLLDHGHLANAKERNHEIALTAGFGASFGAVSHLATEVGTKNSATTIPDKTAADRPAANKLDSDKTDSRSPAPETTAAPPPLESKRWFDELKSANQRTQRERYEDLDSMPFSDAQHIVNLISTGAEQKSSIQNAFKYDTLKPNVRASITTLSHWSTDNPDALLTPAKFEDLAKSDLQRAHTWYHESFDRNAQSRTNALNYDQAKMLETLKNTGADTEQLIYNLSKQSQRTGIEASAVLNFLAQNPEHKVTADQFAALPLENIYKTANLLDVLNADISSAKPRPKGTYPLTDEEIELLRFASSLNDGNKFRPDGLANHAQDLVHAFGNRGIEAQQFAKQIKLWHGSSGGEPLTSKQLDQFMQDPLLQAGRALDAIKHGRPEAVERPAGNAPVTEQEIKDLTKIAYEQRFFNSEWSRYFATRGQDAGWLVLKAKDWYDTHNSAMPAAELERLSDSKEARALRFVDELKSARDNAQNISADNYPISLDEIHHIQALVPNRMYSNKITNGLYWRSLAAQEIAKEAQYAVEQGETKPLSQEWLDNQLNSKKIQGLLLLDSLRKDRDGARLIPDGPFPITLHEANLIDKANTREQFINGAFGQRSAEAKRFAQIQQLTREYGFREDDSADTVSTERWQKLGLAAKYFEQNAADFTTPKLKSGSSQNREKEMLHDTRAIFNASEDLAPTQWHPYFNTWSKLITSEPGIENALWINPNTLKSIAEILPEATNKNYSVPELRGLYDHIQLNGAVPKLRGSELQTAMQAWQHEPDLPDQLAITVGSMDRKHWLASSVAWKQAHGNETDFLAGLSELTKLKDRDLVRRLKNVRSIPDAVELNFGDRLSAVEKSALAKTIAHEASAKEETDGYATTQEEPALKNPFDIVTNLNAKNFSKALAATRDFDQDGSADARAALAGSLIFKGAFPQWLASQSKYDRDLHDSTYWLPIRSDDLKNGPGQLLMQNNNKRLVDLEMVAREWHNLDTRTRQQLDAGQFEQALHDVRSRSYPEAKSKDFAAEAAMWGVQHNDYGRFEKSFLDSQDVPMPFPLDKVWRSGNLTGRFIPRSDPRGLFLGQHTNSCQHPYGQGAACAWYGQTKPNSGFFVIENPQHEIVAESWAWASPDGGLVFDNVEAKGIAKRESNVQSIYQQAANSLIGRYNQVTLGTGLTDLDTAKWPETIPQSLPNDYSKYTDAKTQVLLAESG